jgi:hypothetical protein
MEAGPLEVDTMEAGPLEVDTMEAGPLEVDTMEAGPLEVEAFILETGRAKVVIKAAVSILEATSVIVDLDLRTLKKLIGKIIHLVIV